jgi:hypothetical protein
MKEFTELKAGHQAQICAEIQAQRKAGTLFTAKHNASHVNCKAVAPFKTTDKNGVKIGKGDRCTFWMDTKKKVARLYAITKPEKAPVKAVEAAAPVQPEAATDDSLRAKLMTMTKAELAAALLIRI